MAKLSAHGNEVARYTNPKTGTSYAFMEDRWILVKRLKGEKWRRFHRVGRIGESAQLRDQLLKKGYIKDEPTRRGTK